MIKDEIHFLITTFVLLSGTLLVLLLYLIGRKVFENRHRKRVESYKNKLNDKIVQSIFSGEFLRSLQADSYAKKGAVEELLSHYAEILEGSEEKSNLKKLAESHLMGHYRKNLKSMNWSTRMNALYHVEAFDIAGLKEDVLGLLIRRKVSKEEKIRVLTILSQFQSAHMFELLTREYEELSYLEYRNILFRLRDKGFDQFLLGYHSCQPQLKFAILDLTGLKKDLKYIQFSETVFSISSGEERVRALKALVALGYVRNLDMFLPLFQSVSWEE
ncbi:MAG TPA: hypothetical protein DCR24_15345, partial [Bacillus bacterium]|nr:hypothetical protein [Bacillus sp. (in: firmicutes)]